MIFNDLKLGMQFKLYSEVFPEEFSICKIIAIDKKFTSSSIERQYILVDFDDVNQTTVYGKLDNPIHKFMKRLDND